MANLIHFIRGDTWRTTWTWVDSSGAPINLIGAAVAVAVRARPDAPILAFASTHNGGVSVSDPRTGIISVAFRASDTVSISPGEYMFDQQITWPDGTVTSTPVLRLYVSGDITPP